MDSLEMKQEFLILYDKVTNFDAPGYEDIEISIFLTKAQERVVLSLYNPLVNRVREGFEETEARRKDLQELVKGVTLTTPSTSQSNHLPNGVFYTLPEDFLYAISEEVTLASTDPCINGTRLRVKPITHDFYSINLANPWKKPSVKNAVWRLDYSDGKHELVTDGTYTISQYHLRYMKRLTPIIIGTDIVDGVAGPTNCELNTILHKRIIDEAVKIATGITNPEQYQIKTIEQQKGEV
jgi:hypothetical protein